MSIKKFAIGIIILTCTSICLSRQVKGEKELESLFDSLVTAVSYDMKGARITVLPFTENGGNGSGLGKSLAEFMIVRVQQLNLLTLVDRADFKNVVAEIELSQTGMVEEDATIKIGKMLSSQYLLTGSVSMLFNKYRINAKIINTETTQIVKSAAVNIGVGDLENFSKEMMGQTGKVSSSLFRSTILPGWGQFYTNHNFRGVLSLVAGLGTLGTTGFFIIETGKAKSELDSHASEADKSSADSLTQEEIVEFDRKTADLYDNYSRKYDRAVLFAIITGGVWALNMVDATIAGAQAKKKFQLYFSGDPLGDRMETGVAVRF